MKLELKTYRLPLRAPLTTSHGRVTERHGILAGLSDDGLAGWGDACPMPGWSTHSLQDVRDRLSSAEAKVGRESIEAIIDSLADIPEARAALAGAAADLAAQRAGLPLARWMSADASDRVAVSVAIGMADLPKALAAAESAVNKGVSSIKLKVGYRSIEDDVALVAALRESVGPDVELRLDANGGWSASEASRALDQLAAYDISFCEEPTAGIDAIARLASASPIACAVDESARTVADVERALSTGAIPVLVIKPQAIGGPDLAMEAIGLATKAGVTSIVSSMIDSAIGVAHATQVAAASGSMAAHGVATSVLLAQDVGVPLTLVEGKVRTPSAPGLGVSPTNVSTA